MKFFIRGEFRVESPDGVNLTPKSAKARGLLLLVVRSQHGMRGRRWLQDKLWSDRAQEQGGSSLRQALSQIRTAFGSYADVLGSDRQNVWLDRKRILVVETGAGEIAEGIDVRDTEFELWLSSERVQAQDGEAQPPTGPDGPAARPRSAHPVREAKRLALRVTSESDRDKWTTRLMSDNVARQLREAFSLPVVSGAASSVAAQGLQVDLETFRADAERMGMRVAVSESASGRLCWSGHRFLELNDTAYCGAPVDYPAFVQLIGEITDAVGDTLVEDARAADLGGPDALCRIAIRHLFSMRPEDVRRADELFARAQQMNDCGLYAAWRAQVRTIQRIERHHRDLDVLRESGAQLAALALQKDPGNSMVLALVANTRLFLLGDPAGSFELAERATEINPANAMAWWALSSARLYCGDAENSYKEAMRGRYLASKSPFRFWWDLQQFAAAMMLGRLPEAVQLLERCSVQCETFRPPLRYLVAIHANDGDDTKAQAYARKLKRLEPDFTTDRMIRDGDYPASLLHKASALNLRQISAVMH